MGPSPTRQQANSSFRTTQTPQRPVSGTVPPLLVGTHPFQDPKPFDRRTQNLALPTSSTELIPGAPGAQVPRHPGPLSQSPCNTVPWSTSDLKAGRVRSQPCPPADSSARTPGTTPTGHPAPPTSESALAAGPPGTQGQLSHDTAPATRPGASHAYQTTKSSQLVTKGCTQPTEVTPRAHSSGDQRECRAGTHDVSYKTALLQDQNLSDI